MANKIALITDSTCDIPDEWIKQYDITVVPLTIVWDGKEFLDGVDMKAKAFYEKLDKDPQHPTTSQPTPRSFLDAYQSAVDNGYKEIIVFTISSAMSGTFKSAKQAAEGFAAPVQVVDSKNNSMGLGWQVIAAARVRENGGNLVEMLEAAQKVCDNIYYYISLDTMEYLTKGGRIGDAAKFLSSVIKIKPLICVKNDTGTVGASIPARSRKAAIDGLYKQFFKHINPDLPLHITVLHNAALEEARQLAERLKNTIPKSFSSVLYPRFWVCILEREPSLCAATMSFKRVLHVFSINNQ